MTDAAHRDLARAIGVGELDRLMNTSSVATQVPESEERVRCSEEFSGIARRCELRPGMELVCSELTARACFEIAGFVEQSLNVLLIEGEGLCEIEFAGGSRHPIMSGEASLIAVNERAKLRGVYRAGQRSKTFHLRILPQRLGLEDRNLAQLVNDMQRRSAVTPLLASQDAARLWPLLRASGGESVAERRMVETVMLGLLARSSLMSDWNRQRGTPRRPNSERRKLLRVRERLACEPSRSFRLHELAKLGGLSETSLKTKFRAEFGVSVFEFLREVRLERAREALECSELCVKEVAYEAGYRHVSSFSAAFRKRFGRSPSQAQKTHRRS